MKKDWKLECDKLAKSNDGYCLSNIVKNREHIIEWKCNNGHIWKTSYRSANKSWCNYCSGKRLSFDLLNNFAQTYGGKCLKFVKGKKHKWQCKEGHIWESKYNKNWCPYCANNIKKTFQECNNLASTKECKCLDNSNCKKIKWQCKYGHIWHSSYNYFIKHNCRRCYYKKKVIDIKRVIDKVEKYNGKYISGEINNANSKLKFECKNGHIWETTPNIILYQESWCPHCQINFGEEICRQIFNYVFKGNFIKTKPNWLISPKGWKLELDGLFNNIAFEYNGPRHYKEFFNNDLEYTKICDKIKINKCKEKGIKLFVIKSRKKNYQDVILNVFEILKKNGINFIIDDFKIDWDKINITK